MARKNKPSDEVKVWNPYTGTLDVADTTDQDEMNARIAKAEKAKIKALKNKKNG